MSNKEEESAMIRSDSRAVEYLTEEDLSLSGLYARALFQGTDLNKIPLIYKPISNFKILARTKPYLVWGIFAIPVFIVILLVFLIQKIRKRFRYNRIRTYDDLLKFSKNESAKKFNSKPAKQFLGDLFLFLSTFCTLIYLCWRFTCSIPYAYGWVAIIGSCILLAIEVLILRFHVSIPSRFWTLAGKRTNTSRCSTTARPHSHNACGSAKATSTTCGTTSPTAS